MILFLNGKFVDEEKAVISPLDHGFYFGDGIYETMRTVSGKLWQLEKHLARLFRSAELISLKIPWPKTQLETSINQTIDKNKFAESRIRLTISRGELNLDFKKLAEPTLLIRVEPLKDEHPDVYFLGVDVGLLPAERFVPEAKTLNMLPLILAFQKAQERGFYEMLFVNKKGFVTEGAITNCFMVKNGILLTPNEEILFGTTRDFILEIARKEKIKVVFKNLRVDDLRKADECFICNAPRGIIPVRRIEKFAYKKVGFEMANFLKSKFPF